MVPDPRAQLIIDQITAAAREVKPDFGAMPLIDVEDMEKITFCLKLFDRILPMVVSAVVIEYKKQTKL